MTLNTTPGAAIAEAFASVAEADAYFAARGVVKWVGSEADKEDALRSGTDYLENQYRSRWPGVRTYETQSLSWPRVDSRQYQRALLDADGFPIGTDVIPVAVKYANIEAALLVQLGVNMQPRLVRGGAIKRTKTEIGGAVLKEIEYHDGAPAEDRFLAIEGLLRGLVTSSPGATSGCVPLVRA